MELTDPITLIARHVFNKRCVECAHNILVCPPCQPGYSCSQVASSCTTCAHRICSKDSAAAVVSAPASASTSSGGPNIGAIAGGVIGGVVLIIFATFLIWRFCLKNRRQTYDEGAQDDSIYGEKTSNSDFNRRRAARASTHTVGSVASTVMTRASNVIQIAYIPGIENRSDTDSPSFIPPLPELSPAHTGSTPPRTPYTDQEGSHFFTAEDLRDSYADDAGAVRRSNYTRQSLTPSLARESVASTVYRSNAVVQQVPAQQIVRGRPNIVSVKSSPSIPIEKFNQGTSVVDYVTYAGAQVPRNQASTPPIERSLTANQAPVSENTPSSTSAPEQDAIGPSLLHTPTIGGSLRPMSRSPGPHSALATLHETNSSSQPSLSSMNSQSGSEAGAVVAQRSSPTLVQSSSSSSSGSDSPSGSSGGSTAVTPNLAAAIQEATRRASMTPRHGGLGSVSHTGPSPFGDENAIKET